MYSVFIVIYSCLRAGGYILHILSLQLNLPEAVFTMRRPIAWYQLKNCTKKLNLRFAWYVHSLWKYKLSFSRIFEKLRWTGDMFPPWLLVPSDPLWPYSWWMNITTNPELSIQKGAPISIQSIDQMDCTNICCI